MAATGVPFYIPAVAANGTVASSFKVNGWVPTSAGAPTATRRTFFADAELTTPASNPATLGASGRVVYVNPALSYAFTITDAAGAVTYDTLHVPAVQSYDATTAAFAALSFTGTNSFLRATAADTFVAEDAAAHRSALDVPGLSVSNIFAGDIRINGGQLYFNGVTNYINCSGGDWDVVTANSTRLRIADASGLATFYDSLFINGTTTAAGTGPPVTVNSTNSNELKIILQNAGSTVGYIGSGATYAFSVANGIATTLTRWTHSTGLMEHLFGMVVGTPTGGDKGVGTINAGAVYDDNVLLTDLVLDVAVDGAFDETKYANHPIAREVAAWWFDADQYADFWRANRHLPGMVQFTPETKPSTGESITRLTAVVETQAALIESLNRRLKALER